MTQSKKARIDETVNGNHPSTHEAANAQSEQSTAAADPDPFAPESLTLSQDFGASLGVKKALLTIPVRKPEKTWWVRTNPDIRFQLQTAVIELKEERETYLVVKELWPELASEPTFSPRALFLAINRQNVVFFWPVRLPGSDGKLDEWSRTALEAANIATEKWVRVTSNMSLGAYEVSYSVADWGKPDWPEMELSELLKIAFRDRLIDRMDHPVLQQLRGEV